MPVSRMTCGAAVPAVDAGMRFRVASICWYMLRKAISGSSKPFTGAAVVCGLANAPAAADVTSAGSEGLKPKTHSDEPTPLQTSASRKILTSNNFLDFYPTNSQICTSNTDRVYIWQIRRRSAPDPWLSDQLAVGWDQACAQPGRSAPAGRSTGGPPGGPLGEPGTGSRLHFRTHRSSYANRQKFYTILVKKRR